MFIATGPADPSSSVGAACFRVGSDMLRGVAGRRFMPLLRSLAGGWVVIAINMALLTELAQVRSQKMRVRCSAFRRLWLGNGAGRQQIGPPKESGGIRAHSKGFAR